ncbi:MAG: hypothetical protein LUG55_06950, partial [Clostridiales bacterium]|nr:hypothetical protein [Clostridiales bacterium]
TNSLYSYKRIHQKGGLNVGNTLMILEVSRKQEYIFAKKAEGERPSVAANRLRYQQQLLSGRSEKGGRRGGGNRGRTAVL